MFPRDEIKSMRRHTKKHNNRKEKKRKTWECAGDIDRFISPVIFCDFPLTILLLFFAHGELKVRTPLDEPRVRKSLNIFSGKTFYGGNSGTSILI